MGIPSGFAQQFDPVQQAAMLTHELAHVKAHDALWQLISDLAVAAWWWHPLAWWAHRQWLVSCEMAADEASVLIEQGPNALAEGLVALGRQLNNAALPPGMCIEGNRFRSLLGRRVDRLLKLKHPVTIRPIWMALFLAGDFSILLFLALWVAALGVPRLQGFEGTQYSSWRQSWQHSLAGIAMAAVQPEQNIVSEHRAASSPDTNTHGQAVSRILNTDAANQEPLYIRTYSLGPCSAATIAPQ